MRVMPWRQDRLKLALRRLHADQDVAQGGIDPLEIARQGRQRTAEIVGDRQHVLGEPLDAELAFLLDILLGTAAHVLRFGNRPQMLVLKIRILGLELLDASLEIARLGWNFEVVGILDRHLSRGAARGWIAGHTLIPS